MNHAIYILAGFVLATGILAFCFFSGLGCLFLLVFLRSNGQVLDLYRITRMDKRPEELDKTRMTVTGTTSQAGQFLPQPSLDLDPQTSQDDDLALSLAAAVG